MRFQLPNSTTIRRHAKIIGALVVVAVIGVAAAVFFKVNDDNDGFDKRDKNRDGVLSIDEYDPDPPEPEPSYVDARFFADSMPLEDPSYETEVAAMQTTLDTLLDDGPADSFFAADGTVRDLISGSVEAGLLTKGSVLGGAPKDVPEEVVEEFCQGRTPCRAFEVLVANPAVSVADFDPASVPLYGADPAMLPFYRGYVYMVKIDGTWLLAERSACALAPTLECPYAPVEDVNGVNDLVEGPAVNEPPPADDGTSTADDPTADA